MNLEKAREYFSAYHEGTLERGLKEAFERSLRTDAQVQAEYHAFERLMQDLEVLKQPVPDPDFDLHEAVSRRLDRHLHEEKRRSKLPIWAWWKSLALGGLATAALVMTVLQINSSGDTGMMSIVPTTEGTGKVELLSGGGGFRLEYATREPKTVTIRAADDSILAERRVAQGRFVSALENPNDQPKLLKIEIDGQSEKIYAALPGRRNVSAASGEGSLQEFALALAGFYRTAVLLTMGEDVQVSWNFTPGDGTDDAEQALAGSKYTVHKSADGVLSIHTN